MNWIRNFNADFDDLVADYGERIALIAAGEAERQLTYAQLDVLADRHIAWMRMQGIGPGDCVGAVLPNSLEMLSLFVACLRGGIGFAPLACDTAAAEVQRWAALVQPCCCFYSPLLADGVVNALQATGRPCLPIEANGAFAHLPPAAAPQAHAEGARLYLFSSGTTGTPKAIVLDSNRLWSAGHAFARLHGAGFEQPFRIWNYLPQSYLGGLFNMALIPFSVAGSVVVDEIFSGKTFLGFWQMLERYDINVLWFVPAIVRGLLVIGERTHRQQVAPCAQAVRLAFLGTAPIERDTKTRFEQLFGLTLLENFALSETTFLTSEFAGETGQRSEGSVGRYLPYAELRFRPVAGEDAEFSEILVRTPFMMLGYLDEAGVLRMPDDDGFFPTGDLGYLNAAGQLALSGRSRDVIKKGGYFIALREIELLAQSHPAVAEAAACATPHPFYGESYRLKLRLHADAPVGSGEDARDFVYSALAKYKWPDGVDMVDDFPSTASGKIRKFMMNTSS
ncbi:MAG: class I adenylate-forming enzyme family protein [Pseudomonadota bacterium]|nr:class I adenylate-forming enzyme family protein [Pseudomonadota bacterium]